MSVVLSLLVKLLYFYNACSAMQTVRFDDAFHISPGWGLSNETKFSMTTPEGTITDRTSCMVQCTEFPLAHTIITWKPSTRLCMCCSQMDILYRADLTPVPGQDLILRTAYVEGYMTLLHDSTSAYSGTRNAVFVKLFTANNNTVVGPYKLKNYTTGDQPDGQKHYGLIPKTGYIGQVLSHVEVTLQYWVPDGWKLQQIDVYDNRRCDWYRHTLKPGGEWVRATPIMLAFTYMGHYDCIGDFPS